MLAQEVKTNYLPCTLLPCQVHWPRCGESSSTGKRKRKLSSLSSTATSLVSFSTVVVHRHFYNYLCSFILLYTDPYCYTRIDAQRPGRDHRDMISRAAALDHVQSARLSKGQSTPTRETAAAGHGLMRPVRCELSDLAQCPAR